MKAFKVVFLLLIILSCGEKKADDKKEGFEMNRSKKVEAKETDDNAIAISGNDMMKFDKEELRVKAGKKVTLTLRHVGKLDKMVMGHNFVLLKKDTDLIDFGTKAAGARDNDYIPQDTDAVIAHTKIIGGGETTSITFDAPEPGTYDFLCSFPGHYSLMQGKFIVE